MFSKWRPKYYVDYIVGVEPTTFWSEVRRANPLHYAVIFLKCSDISYFEFVLTCVERVKNIMISHLCRAVGIRLDCGSLDCFSSMQVRCGLGRQFGLVAAPRVSAQSKPHFSTACLTHVPPVARHVSPLSSRHVFVVDCLKPIFFIFRSKWHINLYFYISYLPIRNLG